MKKFIFLFLFLILISSVSAWYGEYPYRMEVNNLTTSNMHFSVNGTVGFQGLSVWINPSQCGGDIKLYYHNTSNYTVVCNDSSEMYFDSENGGLTRNGTLVYIYQTSAQKVFHLNNTSVANYASSLSSYGTGTDPTPTTGVFFGGYRFYGNEGMRETASRSWAQQRTINCFGKLENEAFDIPIMWNTGEGTASNGMIGLTNSSGNFLSNAKVYRTATLRSNLVGSTNRSGEWVMVTSVYDGSVVRLYENGNFITSASPGSEALTAYGDYLAIPVYATGLGYGYWNGSLDECFSIFGTHLSATTIQEFYNNSQNLNTLLGEEEQVTLEFSETYPANDTSVSPNVTIWASVSAGEDFNCSLYLNDTLNATNDGNSAGFNVNVTFPTNISEGSWNYFVNCYSASYDVNSTEYTFDITSDTCTYGGTGDWTIESSDNCIFSANANIDGNVIINGGGILTLNSVWTFTGSNQYVYLNNGTTFIIGSGGSING